VSHFSHGWAPAEDLCIALPDSLPARGDILTVFVSMIESLRQPESFNGLLLVSKEADVEAAVWILDEKEACTGRGLEPLKTKEDGPIETGMNNLCPPGLVLILSENYVRIKGFSNACFIPELYGGSVGRRSCIIRVNVSSISFEVR